MTDYYLAPDGNDGNPGTATRPFGSLQALLDALRAGDTGHVRSGTYRPTGYADTDGTDGTQNAPIQLVGHDDDPVVFDFGDGSYGGLRLWQSDWWELRDFTVRNAPSRGIYVFGGSENVTIENVVVEDSGGDDQETGTGVVIYNAPDAYLRNVVVRGSYNPSRPSDSDGIAVEGSPGTLIEDCAAIGNADDGFDLWLGTDTTIRRSWAIGNGYGPQGNEVGDGDGFKLGGGDVSGDHVVTRCVAYDNLTRGFDTNGATRPVVVANTTALDHPSNYRANSQGRLWNNVSVGGGVNVTPATHHSNSWDEVFAPDEQFQSLDPQDDGFLRLTPNSPYINTGDDPPISLLYVGPAPDLGAFESEPNFVGNPHPISTLGWGPLPPRPEPPISRAGLSRGVVIGAVFGVTYALARGLIDG